MPQLTRAELSEAGQFEECWEVAGDLPPLITGMETERSWLREKRKQWVDE